MNDHDLDLMFDALRRDDGSHLGSVSARVTEKIEAGTRRRRIGLWASLAAAAALIAVAIVMPRTGVEGPGPAKNGPAAGQRPAPLAASHEIATGASRYARPTARRTATLRKRASKAKAGPLEVRMQTDDPDVLIIWLVDGEEEGQKGNQ